MMKCVISVVSFLIVLSLGHAQSREAVSISAGMSLPNAPAQFYDYWSPGWGGSIQHSSRVEYFYGWSVSAEYNYFAFDSRKFLDHFSVVDPNAVINGASTSIYSGYGAVDFYLPEFESITVSPFIGLGGLYTSVSEADITYTFLNTTAPSDSKFLLIFPYGIKFMSRVSENYNIFLEAKMSVGLNRLKDKNTDFASIRAGVRLKID